MNRGIIACAVAAGLAGIPAAIHAQAGTPYCVTAYMQAHGQGDLAAAKKACHIPVLLKTHPNAGAPACMVAYEDAHGGPVSAGAAVKACGITPAANRNIRFTNNSGLVILSIEVIDGPTDAKQTLYEKQTTLITAPADHDVGIAVGNNFPDEPPLVEYYPAGSSDISFVMNANGVDGVFSAGGSNNPP